MSSPPIPSTANLAKPVMLSTSHAKFCPKKPVMKVSGRNTVARIVSCSHCAVLAHADPGLFHGDDGHVRLQDGGEEVLLGSDFLADEMQVVVHVAQVWPEFRVIDIALDASEDGE